MDNVDELHEHVIKELLDAGLIDVLQGVALNTMGVHVLPEPNFPSLSVDVDNAMSALLMVTQALDQSDAIFDAALQDCQTVWTSLAGSLREVDSSLLSAEDVTSAISYSTHLKKFRALWLLLFGPTYPPSSPREVPPHMFAVCWSRLQSADQIEWIRAAQKNPEQRLSALQSGTSPAFAYLLFMLQHALAVRITLLECLAALFENSAACIDLMVVVRFMYVAHEALREVARLQTFWERMGLLPFERIASCARIDDYEVHVSGVFGNASSKDPAVHCAGRTPVLLLTRCPFLWILQRLVRCMYGRLSLLFGNCLFMGTLPVIPHQSALQQGERRGMSERQQHLGWEEKEEEEEQQQKQHEEKAKQVASSQLSSISLQPPFYLNFADAGDGDRKFLEMCGCHLLGELLWDVTHERDGATLFIITDCTQRPGRLSWQHNRYTVTNFSFDDDVSERQGLGHWVFNLVFPCSRFSQDASKRAQQESMLLHAVVFRVAGSAERRLRLENTGSVFYVVRSDDDTDGGRLYFILLLRRDAGISHLTEGLSMTKEAAAAEKEESRWAFHLLEAVCAAWSMPQICNLAIRLAAWAK